MSAIIILIIISIITAYIFLYKLKLAPSKKIEGSGIYNLEIVGESHYQDALEKICGGRTTESVEYCTEATLVLENNNSFDKMAVRVDIHGHTVGYLSKNDARKYRTYIKKIGMNKQSLDCNALIVGGWQRSKGDVGNFGVKLDISI